MIEIVKKSKNSISLCKDCAYQKDCKIHKKYSLKYNIISCPLDKPQDNEKDIHGLESKKKGKK